MSRWAIIRDKTDEIIEVYEGSFNDVMSYVNGRYEDGDIDIVDVEIMKNWQKGIDYERTFKSLFQLWIYVGRSR